jgi:hypothetical protein
MSIEMNTPEIETTLYTGASRNYDLLENKIPTL